MFTLDIKAIRNEYENLSALVDKANNTTSERDLTAMARTITDEDMQQIFSTRYGGKIDATTKTTDNAIFAIILDATKGELTLSPHIGIKDHNGIVVMEWNIRDEIMTLLK